MFSQDLFSFLDTNMFWGNTLSRYVLSLATFIFLLGFFQLLQTLILKRVELLIRKTKTDVDDIIVRILQTIKPPFYSFVAFYIALRSLTVQGTAHTVVNIVLIIWATLQVILALQVAADYLFTKRVQREEHGSHKAMLEFLKGLSRFLLWIIGLLFVLSNLGVNITSLIAGLGISGIAIALATQNILSDLFSSLVIYFDQPFSPGDFIELGDDKGTVQKIGIKTTRIRSLRGEEIVVPNKDIAAARIKNFKRLTERRVEFILHIPYDVPAEELEKIPGVVKKVVENTPNTQFERAHLHAIEDGELKFIVVYFVKKSEFNDYMDAHQAVLLGIKAAFDEAKIQLI